MVSISRKTILSALMMCMGECEKTFLAVAFATAILFFAGLRLGVDEYNYLILFSQDNTEILQRKGRATS